MRKSGKPDFRCIHALWRERKDVDGRDKPGHDGVGMAKSGHDEWSDLRSADTPK